MDNPITNANDISILQKAWLNAIDKSGYISVPRSAKVVVSISKTDSTLVGGDEEFAAIWLNGTKISNITGDFSDGTLISSVDIGSSLSSGNNLMRYRLVTVNLPIPAKIKIEGAIQIVSPEGVHFTRSFRVPAHGTARTYDENIVLEARG